MPHPVGALLLACLAASGGAEPRGLRGAVRGEAASSAPPQSSDRAPIGGPAADVNWTEATGEVLFVGLPDFAGADAVEADGSFSVLLADPEALQNAGGWHAGHWHAGGYHAPGWYWHAGGYHAGGWYATALAGAGADASLENTTAGSENASFADLSVLTNETAAGAFAAFLNSSNISKTPSAELQAYWHAGGWHAGGGAAGGWHAGHWHAGGYHPPGWAYHPGGWHAGGWHGGCNPYAGCHAGHWHAGGWHYVALGASMPRNATNSTTFPGSPQRSSHMGTSSRATKSSVSNVFVVRVPMRGNATDSPSIRSNHSVMLFANVEAFWHAGGWHLDEEPLGGWHVGHWHAGGYHAPSWYWHAGGYHAGGWYATALAGAGADASLENATAGSENASFADLSVLTNETAAGAFSTFVNSSNISKTPSAELQAYWHAGGWHTGGGAAGGWHAGHWHAGGYHPPGWAYHPGGWHAGGWHGGCNPYAGCHAGHWHAGGWHW